MAERKQANSDSKQGKAETAEKKRDIGIDVLRVLGLIGVILAHCSIPGPLFEVREFDVTMLVLASGMSYACAKKVGEDSSSFGLWIRYVLKRFRRLVVPVWVFLVFFFLFFHFIFGISFGWRYIISSFALTSGGIQFVWVFRVFFTSAIFNPLLEKTVSKKGAVWSAICFGAVLAVNEVLIYAAGLYVSGTTLKLLNYIVFYTVSYAMISGLGIAVQRMKEKEKTVVLSVSGIVFLVFGIVLGWPSLQDYKYPPQLFYISYGMIISMAVDLLVALRKGAWKEERRWLLWLSRHSMDIYIAHIFVIYLIQALNLSVSVPWIAQFALYFGFSIVLVLLFLVLFKKKS